MAELAGALSAGGGAQLESLSLGYNDVGDEGAAELGKAAGPRLAVLDLSGNALSGAGLAAVLSAGGLREAKLFHNACGDEGNIVLCRRSLLVPMVRGTASFLGILANLPSWERVSTAVVRKRKRCVTLMQFPPH